MTINKIGPATAGIGATVTYSFEISHGADSDGSPIETVSVTDDIAGAATYDSGDTNLDGALDITETWIFEASYTVLASDPNQLTNTAEVNGFDRNNDALNPAQGHTHPRH